VSSYAEVYVRGVQIFSWRNEIDPTFLFLFTGDEVRRWLERANEDNDYEPRERAQLVATATMLKDRLDVLGIGRAVLDEAFNAYAKEKLAVLRHVRANRGDTVQPDIQMLEKITLDAWVELLVDAIKTPAEHGRSRWGELTSVGALLEIWEDADPRFLLGAVWLACEPKDELVLDVTELIAGGWLDSGFDPQQIAIEHFSYSLANGSPPVIITEETTDARFLQAAIGIRHPHLQSYIKFFDFADGAEGSAAAGVRSLKSFAAAGISNRIVLLLDNDTAARDAVRTLRGVKLPDHYSVLHYPDIEIARSYPTLGPTGLSEMNVNGLAGSIEMYLGVDVLTGADGKLSPIQWRSYIEGMKAYQGEVLDKAGIQKRFREKVKLATAGPAVVATQDWSGLDAIVANLIEVLRGLYAQVHARPLEASADSPPRLARDHRCRRHLACWTSVCLEEVSAGPPAVLVPQDHRPADRGGDLGAVPDVQRQAGPGQPGAELPGAQERGQPAGAGDQVDGLADRSLNAYRYGTSTSRTASRGAP
jgi:hypothetical protein